MFSKNSFKNKQDINVVNKLKGIKYMIVHLVDDINLAE